MLFLLKTGAKVVILLIECIRLLFFLLVGLGIRGIGKDYNVKYYNN